MFLKLPMVAISRGVRKPGPTSVARSCLRRFAHIRTQTGVDIRTMDRVLIDATIFLAPSLFFANSASIRSVARRPPRPDIAHQPAILLLRHEHVPSVAGAHVSVLGR